ncbi:MAG: hypothetical protein AB1847_22810 [bacterium]
MKRWGKEEVKDFAWHVRDMFGITVSGLGTKPVRLRAWPRGTNWQGWYAVGKTKEEAYENLVRVLCNIPASHLQGQADYLIAKARQKAAESAGETGNKGNKEKTCCKPRQFTLHEN